MHVSFHEWEDSPLARCTAAALRRDQVQVWTAAVPADEADWTALSQTLSPTERERAERFLVAEPRRQFVFGRVLLRQLLGACLNVDPATIEFGAAPRGKPFVEPQASYAQRPTPNAKRPPNADLHFNLSHTRSLVAVGLSRDRELGVDLEWMRELTDQAQLAARIFSESERDELNALPELQQREGFFNGWTRKEAYLKATGEGLTNALPAIEVTLAPGQEAKLLRLAGDAEAARQWTMRAIPLPAGFAGAVAFKTDD